MAGSGSFVNYDGRSMLSSPSGLVLAAMGIGLASAIACGTACGPKSIVLSATVAADVAAGAAVGDPFDWSDWSLVLSRSVVGEDVDYRRVLVDLAPLDRFLALVGRSGPTQTPAIFPTSNDRLAYYINCYNASIVRAITDLSAGGVLRHRLPAGLETRYRFEIDGERVSPADLRRRVASLAGDDWRVRLALCDGRKCGPVLWPRPFLGEMLDAQLNQVRDAALASSRVVRIDHEWQRLLLWRGLSEIRARLVLDHEQRYRTRGATILNALLAEVDRHGRERLNTAIGYTVGPLPGCAEVNAFEPPPEDEAASLLGRLFKF